MKRTYIKPFVSFDELEHDTELLAGSPHTETGGTNNDGWKGEGYTGNVQDSEEDAGAKKNNHFFYDVDW